MYRAGHNITVVSQNTLLEILICYCSTVVLKLSLLFTVILVFLLCCSHTHCTVNQPAVTVTFYILNYVLSFQSLVLQNTSKARDFQIYLLTAICYGCIVLMLVILLKSPPGGELTHWRHVCCYQQFCIFG